MKIEIYLDDGRVFSYSVPSESKVREHAGAILKTGYRHSPEGEEYWEWYPPHRILKIKCNRAMQTDYTDSVRGT